MKRIIVSLVSIISFGVVFLGCNAAQPKIDKDKEVLKAPTVQKTRYNDFLKDIGRMYRKYYSPNNPIYFQSKPITNDTGTGGLPMDISKMVTTAISKVGKPIAFIPYDPNYLINEVNTGGSITRVMPKYVISGAITEYDKGVMRESGGSGFDIFIPFGSSGADGSTSNDNSTTASRIAMDFFLLDYATQTMVSGVQTTKTITIFEQSKSKDIGFHILGSGFGVDGSVSRKQGTHAALRLLVELSIAEILAKEAGLPYWKLSKDIKEDRDTIEKIYYDVDGLDEAIKIILLKDYLTKYGFRIENVEDTNLDEFTRGCYELLKKDLNLGDLGSNYITTDDLVKIHFNVPFFKTDKRYDNSLVQLNTVDTTVTNISEQSTDPLESLFSKVDKLSGITNSIYVGSIVDEEQMYKTPFSEEMEKKLKEYINSNSNLNLSEKPIDIKEKTRGFKKRKKSSSKVTKQEVVELVGYTKESADSVELELHILSKDSERLRVIKERFENFKASTNTNAELMNQMMEVAGTEFELKTDDIFFLTDKGESHQVYFDGEIIEFALGVREESYAYIFDIDQNLHINVLFDSSTDLKTKKVLPQELYIIPTPDSDFEIVASEPFGTDIIKVVVSSIKLDLSNLEKYNRGFKKKAKGNKRFIDEVREQVLSQGGILYEKSIIVETRAK